MSGASESRTSKPQLVNDFEETVKDFWASRPRRPFAGRKFAGVAAGLGNRYGIDPVVVRVALVVATVFGGFGVAFYLLGWLFFPGEGDEVSGFEALIGRGRSAVSPAFAVVLCLALLPSAITAFGGGWFDGGGLIGFALTAAALYLLHRSRGQLNRPEPVTPRAKHGAASYATTGTSGTAGSAGTTGSSLGNGAFTMTDTTTAPSPSPTGFDPLAADPAGWDLPEATPPPAPPRPGPPPGAPAPRGRRSKIGSATFGLAIVVAGAGVALNLDGNSWFSLPHIIGLVLAVVGIGMVAGAFVRGGRGLVGLAVPLAIAGMVLTTVPFDNFSLRGGVGDIDATPRNLAELKPVYQHSAGNINLDLTQLPAGEPLTTTITNGAGDTKVVVPATADVTVSCKTNAGQVDCLNHGSSGVGQSATTVTDNGTDGAGGQRITLTVTNTVGNVEVRRG
ncbi:PspC domain-containing protein [Amycolatopsis sp. NPDC059021]|uniref:PspC domain-containing protein n=1 Tax=Amycolatopsis sp. NPDC059021 TaxID=3346704 RepID=UPI00366ECD89